MFAKTIIDSDAFLDMPMTARLLYYDLSMRADDDGFVNSPKKIMRMIGATQDDLGILAMRKFIIPFDTGVVVIKHWKIHNYIRKDTYQETPYRDEKALLEIDENKAYRLTKNDCIRTVDEPSTQYRLGKNSLDKDSLVKNEALHCNNSVTKSNASVTPTLTELKNYISDKKLNVDPQRFFNYYSDKGWNKITDWKAAVEFWHRNERKSKSQFLQEQKADYDMKELEKALLEKTIKEMGTDG